MSLDAEAFWRWGYRYGVDVFCLVGAFACFAAFAHSAVDPANANPFRLATVVSGAGERKGVGAEQFTEVGAGAALFNLDRFWVGKDGGARLSFPETRSALELSEMTLIVLKRPFEPKAKSGWEDSPGLRVLKGQVKEVGTTVMARVENHASEIPTDAKGPDPVAAVRDKPLAGLYPPAGALLYLRAPAGGSTVPLTLAWPQPLQGHVALMQVGAGSVRYFEIRGQQSMPVTLELGQAYHWVVVDQDKKPIFGPYSFESRVLTDDAARQLLREKPRPGVEIHW